jgi:hypothetical protein
MGKHMQVIYWIPPLKMFYTQQDHTNTPIHNHNYYCMMGCKLETIENYPYMGIEIIWQDEFLKATSKAYKILGFIWRNLGKCLADIRDRVDSTKHGYAHTYDMHMQCGIPIDKIKINKSEIVQRRAARFVTSNYTVKNCDKYLAVSWVA